MKFYKFQKINKLTLHNLTNQKNWISDPYDFNDPFEFSFYDRLLIENEEFRYLNSEEKKQAELFKNEISKFGVICYSTNWYNILLWSHYANNHKGMCLVFEVAEENINNLHKINYQNNFPEINYLDNLNTREEIIKIVTTKSIEWEYESEYREIFSFKNVPYEYPGKLIEVIFGCKTPIEDIKMVSNIVFNKDEKTEVSRMFKDSLNFTLGKETSIYNNLPKYWDNNNINF